tara:strand:- start:300 stop:1154 length:855 start_codon:yes stop_codon:yes gene_type:complete
MGRSEDKRRRSSTPRGVDEDLQALLEGARSYDAEEDGLSEDSEPAGTSSAAPSNDPMWLDGSFMRFQWPQNRKGRTVERKGVIQYRPREGSTLVYLVLMQRRAGGLRERRTSWRSLAGRKYVVLSSTNRAAPADWTEAEAEAARVRREAGEPASSIAISLGRTEGAVRSRLKKELARAAAPVSPGKPSHATNGKGSDGRHAASADASNGGGEGSSNGWADGSPASRGGGGRGHGKGKGAGGKGKGRGGKGKGKGKGKGLGVMSKGVGKGGKGRKGKGGKPDSGG